MMMMVIIKRVMKPYSCSMVLLSILRYHQTTNGNAGCLDSFNAAMHFGGGGTNTCNNKVT